MQTRPTLAVPAFMLLAFLWLPSLALAQDIDTYFRRFNAAMDDDNFVEAERYARLMVSSSPSQSWQAAAYNSLGRALRGLEKYDEAERVYQQALSIPLSGDNVNNGWIPNNLALLYISKKRFSEAETMLNRALSYFERTQGTNSGPTSTVYLNFGKLNHDKEDYEAGERFAQKAYAIRKNVYGAEHAQIAFSLGQIADMNRHLKRWDESEKYYKQALAMRTRLFGAESKQVADSYAYMATMYRDAERYPEAEQNDRKALELREKLLGPKHKLLKESLEHLATDLERQERKDAAAPFRERAAQLEAEIANPPRPSRVEIVATTASAMSGPKAVATVKQGQQYNVSEVKDQWYKLRMTIGGEEKSGWVQERDIRVVAYTTPVPSTTAWHTFLPPQGRFTVKFPGEPLNRNLSVAGLTSKNYRVEKADASYEVFYFDLPADRNLPLDQATTAIATQLKGKVKSQSSIERDLYPGREVLVECPENSMVRLQMLIVGRRWYVAMVEGTASSVNGEDANRFLNSFAIAD